VKRGYFFPTWFSNPASSMAVRLPNITGGQHPREKVALLEMHDVGGTHREWDRPSPIPPAMIGMTTNSSVSLAPSPSAVPTPVPTAIAAIEPVASGTTILKNPRMSTFRSIPRILPTITAAMNR